MGSPINITWFSIAKCKFLQIKSARTQTLESVLDAFRQLKLSDPTVDIMDPGIEKSIMEDIPVLHVIASYPEVASRTNIPFPFVSLDIEHCQQYDKSALTNAILASLGIIVL